MRASEKEKGNYEETGRTKGFLYKERKLSDFYTLLMTATLISKIFSDSVVFI